MAKILGIEIMKHTFCCCEGKDGPWGCVSNKKRGGANVCILVDLPKEGITRGDIVQPQGLKVDDVFAIKGRGTVLSIRTPEKGLFNIGDTVSIVSEEEKHEHED
ncbi:MAG: hypothetical protein ACXABY_00600 [Candidatus Thorarchaeota archaeon]|jgi:hypothetical protein